MNILARSSPANVNQSHNSASIPDYYDRSLDQPTIEILERPSKKRGLKSIHFFRPSGRSKVENAVQHSPSGKEKPLQTTAGRVPPSYTCPTVPPFVNEHAHPPSELGNESSTTLAEPRKHTFNPLKLVTMKRKGSTRSRAGKAGSIKSRPQTPALSDLNGTPKTSFDGELGPPQPRALLSHPPLPTPTSASPVPSTPVTKAAKPPIPQSPPSPLFDHPPPPRGFRKSIKQTFNPLKLVTMNRRDSTRSRAGKKADSTKSRPQTPALSDLTGTPETSFDGQLAPSQTHTPLLSSPMPTSGPSYPAHSSPPTKGAKPPIPQSPPPPRISRKVAFPPPPPLPEAPVQRAQPLHPQDSTTSSSSGFDPRSSTYRFIHSAIDFSDPSVPDPNFLDGLDIEATSVATEQEVLDHGGDVEDTHGHEHEENEEENVWEQAKSEDERSRSFSVLTKTLSGASKGALSMFGTGGVGDTHRKRLRKHHQRSDSTSSNEVGQQDQMGGTEKELVADTLEGTTTNDRLGDDEDRVSTDEGRAILTDPRLPNSSPRPTSPPLSASPKDLQSFSLNSPPRSPVPLGRRTASPPLIGFPVLPQAPTITTTAPPPTDDAILSIAFPVPPPSPSAVRTIASILLPKRKHLATHRVSQYNPPTADVTAATSPNTDGSNVSSSTAPESQPPPTPATPPPPPPFQPQSRPPSLAPSSKLRLPTLSVAGQTPTAGPTAIPRERDIGDFLGWKKKLKWIRKKDSGDVSDGEPVHVVKSPDWESPRYAFPVVEGPSTSTTSGGVKDAAPLNSSVDETPSESIQMPVPTTIPPGPRTPCILSSDRDDERPDLGDQHLDPRAGGFHYDPLHRSKATSRGLNSNFMLPQRSSLNTARASLASSNGSDLTTPVDEDSAPSTVTTRAAYALRPPSPQASAFLPVTPVQRSQALQLRKYHGEIPEKEKAFRKSRNIPRLDVTASQSIRTGVETASSTAWSDKEEYSVATTRVPSVRDAGKSPELEGEIDEYHVAQGHEGHPQLSVQRPRMPDLNYTPISTDLDEMDTILRSALDDLTHLSVPPSRLNILPNTEIGWGKYGEVVQAILDDSSQKPVHVAVKELRNVGTRGGRGRIALRLARELKIWAKVDHANILPLIGYYLGENYEIARFISPFMTNGNVTEYFEAGQVGLARRLDITNILINDSLRAVLADFGLASLMQESDTSSGLTTSRTVKGSLRYMSPELLLEDGAKPTLASDVWAWGCTAFEIVTGRLPYEEATKEGKIVLAISQGNQPPGSFRTLMSQLGESKSVDDTPDLCGLPYYLSQCWKYDAKKRPKMSSILDMLCPT